MSITLGQRAKFIEHAATLNDMDSGDVFADTTLFIEGCENVEEKTEKAVLKKHGWMFCGNTVEPEYAGETGRTVMAEVQDIRGKLRWATVEELTPAEMNMDEFLKFG